MLNNECSLDNKTTNVPTYIFPVNPLNVQSEFNVGFQTSGPNQAEIDAKIQEMYLEEANNKKQQLYEANMLKYKEGIILHKKRELEEQAKREQDKMNILRRKEQQSYYNQAIRNENIRKTNMKKALSSQKARTANFNESQRVKTNNDTIASVKSLTKHNETNLSDNNHSNRNINDVLKSNELSTSNHEQDNQVIDLQLNDLITKEISQQQTIDKQKHPQYITRNPHYNERVSKNIQSNLKRVEMFRKEGLTETNYDTFLPNCYTIKSTRPKPKKPKFASEKEKKQFIKAFKHIFTERLGEKNIIIPNICSCGQLQKQLKAIVERGNISVLTLSNIDCANNCIFYNNPEKYKKYISDVLHSIKSLGYDSFK